MNTQIEFKCCGEFADAVFPITECPNCGKQKELHVTIIAGDRHPWHIVAEDV